MKARECLQDQGDWAWSILPSRFQTVAKLTISRDHGVVLMVTIWVLCTWHACVRCISKQCRVPISMFVLKFIVGGSRRSKSAARPHKILREDKKKERTGRCWKKRYLSTSCQAVEDHACNRLAERVDSSDSNLGRGLLFQDKRKRRDHRSFSRRYTESAWAERGPRRQPVYCGAWQQRGSRALSSHNHSALSYVNAEVPAVLFVAAPKLFSESVGWS